MKLLLIFFSSVLMAQVQTVPNTTMPSARTIINANFSWLNTNKAGYPGAGVPNSTGSAWGTPYTVGTGANNLVQLNSSSQLPAVSAALLTNFPTLNQNTTGMAAGLSGAYIDWNASSGGASILNKPTIPTVTGSALLKGSGGNAVAATYGDVTALWTTCTSGWLKYDGTCTTPGGGGSVTSSGSPVIHQLPVFTTGTDIKGIAVGATDTVLMGSTGADPSFVAVANCGDSSHALAYSTSSHTFSCQSITVGGGASQTSDLADCKVSISGAVATIPTPCAITIGTVRHALLSNATATLSGTSSSGTVYFYWDYAGVLTADHATAATLTCANCTTATSGQIPQNSFPLASATFSANSFNGGTLTDLRSAYSNSIVLCGGDLACTGLSGGAVQVDIGPTVATKAGLQSGQTTLCSDTGSANAMVCAPTPPYTGYSAGMVVQVIPANTNTGATTLAISGLTAKAVKLPDGATDVSAGQLIAGQQYQFVYDGTAFRLAAAAAMRVPLTTGTSITLSGASRYFECTGTCTVTLPVPSPGTQYCVRNAAGVSTVITLAALGSSAMYEKADYSAYGTAGTGTLVSGGAAGDRVCLVGKDATHYDIWGSNGTWTAN